MVQVQTEETINISDTMTLSEDFSSLYLNKKFSDLTIVVNDEKFYTHKVILAARSKYFEDLLYRGSSLSKQTIEITDVSPKIFSHILKFIYTGTIVVSPDVNLILELLGLSRKYSMKQLENAIVNEIKPLLNLKNVYTILNTANLHDMEELCTVCYKFCETHALEVISDNRFNDLSQKSVIGLLERDTFYIPEIEIFQSVTKWCSTNNDVDGLVKKCVRLCVMKVDEVVSTVWPSKVVDPESLLRAIAEIVGVKPMSSSFRGLLVEGTNVATVEHKAEVISGESTVNLLTNDGSVNCCAYHEIDGVSAIIVKLGAAHHLNHLKMRLWDADDRSYSYYIEVSADQDKWTKIIDYSEFYCRSNQILYFPQQVVQYIKIVGTESTNGELFHLISFQAYYEDITPDVANGMIYPNTNVATLAQGAKVVKGLHPDELLNGNTENYSNYKGFTDHLINSGNIVIQLAQPYMISTMRLLLWDQDDRTYRYLIETSVDNNKWVIAVDKRNEDCKSWQNLRFEERAVAFVKITGTYNSANEGFHCVHFECPSIQK